MMDATEKDSPSGKSTNVAVGDGDSINRGNFTPKVTAIHQMLPLPDDFVPGNDDVICGRGKKCYSHIGNTRFRGRVVRELDEYSRAKSKLDKSGVLSRVVADVRRASAGGGFVKQNDDGKWYEVGDFLAREKTSQAFRDALHERYKSSNVSKKKRRKGSQITKLSDKTALTSKPSEDDASGMTEVPSEDQSLSVVAGGQHVVTASGLGAINLINQSNSNIFGRFTGVAPTLQASQGLRQMLPTVVDARLPELVSSGNSSFSQSSTRSFPFQSASLGLRSVTRDFGFADSVSSSMQSAGLVFEDDGLGPLHSSHPDMRLDFQATSSGDPYIDMMHRSMPNLHFSGFKRCQEEMESQSSSLDSDIAALHSSMPNLGFFGAGRSPDEPKHARPAHSRGKLPIGEDDEQLPELKRSSSCPRLEPGRANEASDRDIIACLEKLTDQRIADDDPFEPNPIAER